MFSFGQFAHFLPYLILALTSLAGLTSYTFSNTKDSIEDEELSEHKIELEESKTNSTESLASFYSNSNYNSDVTIAGAFQNTIQNSILNRYPTGYVDCFVIAQVVGCHQQRPPPFAL